MTGCASDKIYSGTAARADVTFTAPDAVTVDNPIGLVDPDSLTVEFGPAGGTSTIFAWPAGPEISHDGLGLFHALLPTSGGSAMWEGQWVSTGSHVSTEKFEFYVYPLPWPLDPPPVSEDGGSPDSGDDDPEDGGSA